MGQLEAEVLIGNPLEDVSRQLVLAQGRDNIVNTDLRRNKKLKQMLPTHLPASVPEYLLSLLL